MRPPIMKARMSCIPARCSCLPPLNSLSGAIWPSGSFKRQSGSPQICKRFAGIACAGFTGFCALRRHRPWPRSPRSGGDEAGVAWLCFAPPAPSGLRRLLSGRNYETAMRRSGCVLKPLRLPCRFRWRSRGAVSQHGDLRRCTNLKPPPRPGWWAPRHRHRPCHQNPGRAPSNQATAPWLAAGSYQQK